MNENIFAQVNGYMRSKFYSFNASWLKECVQYCAETHPKLSIQGIQSFAQEQWLLSNLREINNEKGTLPKDLVHLKCTTLPGRYILQIEKMYDISSSKYKQLEKIRNVDVMNLKATKDKDKESESWEPNGKRMYQLFLTDGVQEIQAMEYKPIRFLNETLLPGYKLMIIGPVTCRRGLIMLEENHISGLGGEIEDLLIPNSLENVLARFLNLKENQDPYKDAKLEEEYLNDLEKLARNEETIENGRPCLNHNSSVSNLPSSSKINLQNTSTEQNIDELLTDDELEELLLNDPDIVDEFPLVEYVPNPTTLLNLGQKTSSKVPGEPHLKANEKRKLSRENLNQISRSVKNVKFQDDNLFFNDKKAELSGLWGNHEKIHSPYHQTLMKTSKNTETENKVPQAEASSISDFQDDDFLLDDKDLIQFDSWDNPKRKTSDFYEPCKKTSVVQLSKLSNNNLKTEQSSNGKCLEPKQTLESPQAFKPIIQKSSSDAGLEIKKSESNAMGWKIISNEVPMSKSKVNEKPNLINVDADLETEKYSNENSLEKTNSFGISKPYKPLFQKKSSRIIEKTENEPKKGLRLFSNLTPKSFQMDLQVEISRNEPNQCLQKLNADLDLRMRKLLNEPTHNSREGSTSSTKSTSNFQNADKPSKFETEISGNGYEEITIRSKRLADPVLTISTPPKIHRRSDFEEEKITRLNEELPAKICDFICDLIKEPLTDLVIRRTVKAKIKEKGQLSQKNRRWNLNGLITDGTADLNVEFSTEFMESVIGYSAMDFSLIKKQARKDPKLGERIRSNMRNAQYKLEESDWLVQLELAQKKTPVIVSGTELTEEQRAVFEKRLQILKPYYA